MYWRRLVNYERLRQNSFVSPISSTQYGRSWSHCNHLFPMSIKLKLKEIFYFRISWLSCQIERCSQCCVQVDPVAGLDLFQLRNPNLFDFYLCLLYCLILENGEHDSTNIIHINGVKGPIPIVTIEIIKPKPQRAPESLYQPYEPTEPSCQIPGRLEKATAQYRKI